MTSISGLIKNLGFSLIRQCLPNEAALSKMVKTAFHILLLLVISAGLVTALLIYASIALHQYLLMQGLPEFSGYIVSGLFLMLLTVIALLLTYNKISLMIKIESFYGSEKSNNSSNDFEQIVLALIQGLTDIPPFDTKSPGHRNGVISTDPTPNINKSTHH